MEFKVGEYNVKAHELLGLAMPVIVLLFVFKLLGLLLLGDIDFLREYIEAAGIWAPLVFMLAKASTIIFAPLSGTPLYVLVGGFFGFWDGLLYVFFGDVLGFSVLFFLGYKYGLKALSFLRITPESKPFQLMEQATQDLKTFATMGVALLWFPELTIFVAGMSKLRFVPVMLIFMPLYTAAASVMVLLGAGIFSL